MSPSGDFHYNGTCCSRKVPQCAARSPSNRITPATSAVSAATKNFRTIVAIAIAHDKPVRIGVNWGSLDQQLLTEMMDAMPASPSRGDARDVTMDAMVASAMRLGRARRGGRLRTIGSSLGESLRRPGPDRGVPQLASLSTTRSTSGLTEAGMGAKGSSRVPPDWRSCSRKGSATRSASPSPPDRAATAPERSRSRSRSASRSGAQLHAQVTACPGAAGPLPTSFRRWPRTSRPTCAEQRPLWQARYPGVERLRVAVMGCVVNGPGRVQARDIASRCRTARSRSAGVRGMASSS